MAPQSNLQLRFEINLPLLFFPAIYRHQNVLNIFVRNMRQFIVILILKFNLDIKTISDVAIFLAICIAILFFRYVNK